MKKLIGLLVLLPLLYACPTVEGNLVGVKGRDVFDPDILGPGRLPVGMVYVKSGGYQSGVDDEDIMGVFTSQKKTVSVQAFYMDASEISNNEYRQFVHWVRDSIAREKLYRRSFDDDAEQWVSVPDNFFKEPYRTLMDMGSDIQGGNTPFQLIADSTNNSEVDKTILGLMGNIDQTKMKKLKNNALINGYKVDAKSFPAADKKIEVVMSEGDLRSIFQQYTNKEINNGVKKTKAGTADKAQKSSKSSFDQGGRVENRKYFTLNWEQPIEYSDPETSFILSDMYYGEAERFYNRKEMDTRLLFFDYYWIDYKEAAKRGKVLTKSVDARRTYGYDSLSPDADYNLYKRSKREPLSKDYKKNDLHRATLDQNGQNIWLDTTIFSKGKQWGEVATGAPIDKNQYSINDTSHIKQTILENPGQDLDIGFTNSKG